MEFKLFCDLITQTTFKKVVECDQGFLLLNLIKPDVNDNLSQRTTSDRITRDGYL